METHEGETVVWHGNPSWRSMLLFYVKWTLLSLLPTAAWVLLDAAGADIAATWFGLATLLLLVASFGSGWVVRATTRYTLTNRRIHIRTGLVSRNERSTHVDRIQNVNVRQGPVQRLLGIGDVDWDTAGTDAAESEFTFRGIDDPGALVRLADRHYGQALHETAPPQV